MKTLLLIVAPAVWSGILLVLATVYLVSQLFNWSKIR